MGTAVRVFAGRSSVRTRLMLWNMAVLTAILALLGATIQVAVHSALLGSIDRELIAHPGPHFHGPPPFPGAGPPHADWPEGQQQRHWHGPPPPGMQPPQTALPPPDRQSPLFDEPRRPRPSPADPLTGVLTPHIFDLNGVDMFRPGTPPWDAPALESALRGRESLTTVTFNGERLRVYSRPLRHTGRIVAAEQIPARITDRELAVAGTRNTLLMLIPVGLLLAALGAAAVTAHMLRPVRELVTAAAGIGAADLAQRLPARGNDEFAHLAHAFNSLLARLDAAFREQRSLVRRLEQLLEQQRRFTADASHELKTPLTAIKGNAGLLLRSQDLAVDVREPVQDIYDASEAMNGLIKQLLDLARADAGAPSGGIEPVAVAPIVERAVRAACAQGGAPVRIDLPDPALEVPGIPGDLERVLTNLLTNALRYTPPDGEVCVSARADQNTVTLCVADTGPGIPPEHLPHLGERFYRVDASRARQDGGAGLGLAICKSIVQAHGGAMHFESEVGKGTRVYVILPRRDAAA